MCSTLGIKTVSIYALSIGNFGRPKEELHDLMDFCGKEILRQSAPGYVLFFILQCLHRLMPKILYG